MFIPRHGQWVRFKSNLVGLPESIHRTKDGKWMIGIYQRAGRDSRGEFQPARVVPVNEEGKNVNVLGVNGILQHLWLPVVRPGIPGVMVHINDAGDVPTKGTPSAVIAEMVPVTERDDIPAARLATAKKNWKPLP